MSKLGINLVTLIGHLGRDPEYYNLENKRPTAKTSLATSESWKKDNQEVTDTEWHNIVFYNHLAKTAYKYFKKVRKIFVRGKIKTQKWQDKEGVDRQSTDIIAHDMQLLDSPKGQQPSTSTNRTDAHIEAAFNKHAENKKRPPVDKAA